MQHTFSLHRRMVRLSVTHQGKQYRRATGLHVYDKSLWKQKAKSLRAMCKDTRIFDKLNLIHAKLIEREPDVKTEAQVLATIDYALYGIADPILPGSPLPAMHDTPTFWEYFEEWARRPSSSQRQRALACRKIAQLMGRKENWNDIDSAYWFRLQMKMEAEGYSVNYRWNLGARLKVVMHEGYRLKYHDNQDFREFRSKKEQTEAIALSHDEIELLWNYTPRNDLYGRVRDLALIGYYSASRFSDYSRLSLDNINNGRLEFVQQKTGDKVVIPAAPRLVLLLERNGGIAPAVNQVVFNRYIKTVAKEAGITGKVAVKGKLIDRWDMVQSHSFRRSALTELYLSGLSARDCMFVSGHKSIGSFERYLRIGKEQAIGRLADVGFFR